MRKALPEISTQEQVIVATHSPIIIAPDMIDRTVRLDKTAAANGPRPVTITYGPLKTSELPASEREIQRLFEIQRSAKFLFARGVLLVEGVGDEHLVAAAAMVRKGFDFDFHEIAIIESGGKDKVLPFMAVLRKLGLKTWGLLDLDFLWNGAGEIFHADTEYSTFRATLDKLAPTKDGSRTESERKEEKRKKVEVCNGDLSSVVQSLAKKLLNE